MEKMKIFFALALALIMVHTSSALVVSDVSVDAVSPGGETRMEITLKNTFNFDVEEAM